MTGRDIAENEYAVKTDQGIWSLDGMDLLDAAATVRTRAEAEQQSRLGSQSLDAVKFVNARSSTTPAELAAHLRIDNRLAGNLLARLAEAGYIDKPSRGTYTPISSGENGDESGESSENAGQTLFTVSPPADHGDESGETTAARVSGNSPLSPPTDVSGETKSGPPPANSPLSSDSSPLLGRDEKISGGAATLIRHSAVFGVSTTPVRKFTVGKVQQPYAQYDRAVSIDYVQPRKRRDVRETIMSDNLTYIVIESGGHVVYDSRTDVPCDMDKWEQTNSKFDENRPGRIISHPPVRRDDSEGNE